MDTLNVYRQDNGEVKFFDADGTQPKTGALQGSIALYYFRTAEQVESDIKAAKEASKKSTAAKKAAAKRRKAQS